MSCRVSLGFDISILLALVVEGSRRKLEIDMYGPWRMKYMPVRVTTQVVQEGKASELVVCALGGA